MGVTEKNVCAISSTGGEDVCRGDSGGPLYGYSASGDLVLVGISSFGDPDCNKNSTPENQTPSVFTSAFSYKDWLDLEISLYNSRQSQIG